MFSMSDYTIIRYDEDPLTIDLCLKKMSAYDAAHVFGRSACAENRLA